MKTIERIKEDLATLAKARQILRTHEEAEKHLQKDIAHIKRYPVNAEQIEAVQKLNATIESLQVKSQRLLATNLEYEYSQAFEKLPPIERSLIIERYINGKTYEQIADNYHYSAERVRKKIGEIIGRIQKLLG